MRWPWVEAGFNKTPMDVTLLMPFASPDFAKQLLGQMALPDRNAYLKEATTEYQKQIELVRKLEEDQKNLTAGVTQQKAAVGMLGANVTAYQMGSEKWATFLVQATAKAKGALLGGGDISAETKALGELVRQFQQLSETGAKGFGLKEFEALQQQAQDLMAKPTITDWDKAFITNQLANAKFLADQAETLKKLQSPEGQPRDIRAELEKAQREADRLKELIDKLKPEAAKQMGEGAKAAESAMTTMPDMSGLAADIQAAATAMWDLALASQNVMPPEASMNASKGGMAWNFLAFGGSPRGTDAIPAMLSPGEVVINAASARRFSAQLTAINAGVQPVYRSEGGSVTNIGDINVTVSGGGTSRQTARSIAAELRRELRRGTATF